MDNESLIDALLQHRQSAYKEKRHTNNKVSNWAVLYYISSSREDPVYPMDLCKHLGVTTARVTAILNDMEADGLIIRSASETDKRKVCLTLGEKGRQMVEQHDAAHRREAQLLLEAVGPEAVETYLRVAAEERRIISECRRHS